MARSATGVPPAFPRGLSPGHTALAEIQVGVKRDPQGVENVSWRCGKGLRTPELKNYCQVSKSLLLQKEAMYSEHKVVNHCTHFQFPLS